MFTQRKSLIYLLIILLPVQLLLGSASYANMIPDDYRYELELPEKNSQMFWIWDEDLNLLQGSANPDTQKIYLASLTKAYTLNKFLQSPKDEITITKLTPYNYTKVRIGDTLSYVDAITAILVRSCNTVSENMLDAPPKDGFISSSGLPAIINGVRYENMDTPTNVLNAFVENGSLIEIYQRIYDGKYGHTTYRKWTAHKDLHFSYIKTGFTDQAGKCVFIKTNNHYFLFVGWEKHSQLVNDSISMVRIFEHDHSVPDLQSIGQSYLDNKTSTHIQ